MKTIWMALHDLRHDIGFALFLILELSISVFFLASSFGCFHDLHTQMNLAERLGLDQMAWVSEEPQDEELTYIPLPSHVDVVLPLTRQAKDQELSVLPAQLSEQLGFDALKQGMDDTLPVIVREGLLDGYEVGKTYLLPVSMSAEQISVKIIGTYEDFSAILQDTESFGGSLIDEIYSDMLACDSHAYWKAHPQLVALWNDEQGGLCTGSSAQLSVLKEKGAVLISEEWQEAYWADEAHLFSLVTAAVFTMLALSGVAASKALRMLNHQKEESILMICGAQANQRRMISLCQDTILFLPMGVTALLILKGSEMIIDHVSRMSIVYLDSHPHWMFIESLCAPIGPKSIMAAVLICYILYLLLSMLIQHMMSTKRIAQLYSE